MSQPIHEVALFRLSVLGPLASRDQFARGELTSIIQSLANKTYSIPGSTHVRLSPKTIEHWYYLWRRGGIEALEPKTRTDAGSSRIYAAIQAELISIKKEQPTRSIQRLIDLMEAKGTVSRGSLTRSSVHRLLRKHGLSKRTQASSNAIERRSFETAHAGDIWYGDVMHGPRVQTASGLKKAYCVSWMDDHSRLLCHSAFYLCETQVSIEHSLKEAFLKRGLPKKIVVDNGAAYRAHTLQAILARLKVRLVYGRPYEPESKGKLERWHRTLRADFIQEIASEALTLDELNARLWIWIENIYHQRPHAGLNKQSPIERWRAELAHVQPLGLLAKDIDAHFYHRISRRVRKTGTIQWNSKDYEVACNLVGKTVLLVVDPFAQNVKWIENSQNEKCSGVTLLDRQKNCTRKRQRPSEKQNNIDDPHVGAKSKSAESLTEIVYQKAVRQYALPDEFAQTTETTQGEK